jgi:hypothetical protein
MDLSLIHEQLEPARQMLNADGCGLMLAERDTAWVVAITATESARGECLAPQDLMLPMSQTMLDPEGTGSPELRLVYQPGEP